MKKVFTLLLITAATLLCPKLQAQRFPTSFRSSFLEAAVKQNEQIRKAETTRYTASQTKRVAQTETYGIWNDNNQWEDVTKTLYTYNNSGQMETTTDVELPANLNQAKYEYIYNSDGLITAVIFYGWENNAWAKSMKFVLGADNNLEIYYWTNGAWLLKQGIRTTHTTSNGRITESVTEYYSIIPPATQGWEQSDKITYGYTGSDSRPSSSITYEKQGATWVEMERRTDIQYVGSTTEVSSYFLEEFTPELGSWDKYKIEYQYSQDAAQQTRTTKETTSTVEGSTVTPYLRETTTELTSNEIYVSEPIVGSLLETYDEGTSSWMRSTETKANVTRNSTGEITQIVLQEYSDVANGFVNKDRFVYTDFATITVASAQDDVLALATDVYPNPVQDKLNVLVDASKVRNASLTVYNLTGQKVLELHNLHTFTTVDMGKLPRGVYMVRLTDTNSASVARRVVKQ